MADTVNVPCNGCTICCRNELLILHPEMGDVVTSYDYQRVINPITGKPAFALQNKPNGDCIYLGMHGCTIHDRAPAICREFYCRRFFLKAGNRTERKRLVKIGFISKELLEAGRSRLDSLEGSNADPR
ncbi:MAG TPA: YkgJ family cysteine cluster protein [Rhizobium sp.]